MKKNSFVLLTATGLLVAGLAGAQAFAEDAATTPKNPGQLVKDTDTEVNIVDKIDPDEPNQPVTGDEISLEHVPSMFKFKTVVQNKGYDVSSTDISADNTIDVFNNKSERDWNVKASIGKIGKGKDATAISFDVDSFKIGNVEVATGTDTIVHYAKVVAEGTEDKKPNSGLIKSDAIKNISIKFTDADNVLKAGDVLTGQVHYTLSATPKTK